MPLKSHDNLADAIPEALRVATKEQKTVHIIEFDAAPVVLLHFTAAGECVQGGLANG